MDSLIEFINQLEFKAQGEGYTLNQVVHLLKHEVKPRAEQLQAENEQLRKDAERYRFLRDKANANKGNPFISILNNGVFSQWDGESADEAIDKTMAETK